MDRSYKLHEIDNIIDEYDSKKKTEDINHILDLYAVFELLKNGQALTMWNKKKTTAYLNVSKDFPRIIGTFVSGINDNNILEIHNSISTLNKSDFWKMFNDYKVFEKVSNEKIKEILKSRASFHYILSHRKIVEKYEDVLSEHIKNDIHSIEFILSKILSYDGNTTEIVMPKSLLPSDIVILTEKYIDSERPNPNFLDCIANSKFSKECPITDDVRLKAKKAYNKFWEESKKEMLLIKNGIEVSFKPNLEEDKYIEWSDNIFKHEYNSDWITENLDFPTLLNNFIYLFGFTDLHCRSSYVYKSYEVDVVEQLFCKKGKDYYPTSYTFYIKNKAFSLVLSGYIYELKMNNLVLEEIFEWFFKTYLRNEFNVDGFVYIAPSNNATTLEKCILLACAIDAVLKQFNMYCKYGQINRELFEMSSNHVVFSDVRSLTSEKYVYAESTDIKKEQHLLFSDSSFSVCCHKTKSEYDSLFDLLHYENLTQPDFLEYQVEDLQWLLSRKSLVIDKNGFIKPTIRAGLLKDLYNNEVLCYQYNKKYYHIIDNLLKEKELKVEGSLFSVPEQKYLNYILNRKDFGNGMDLRNSYVHGTYSLNINQQETDYIELLKIMVLIIIKINEEFCLKFPI